mmetsp:Transcript_30460/g.29843  ORF Transcript_30460/g.29843 Transcript_30460/m.29843 type:complete len:142 (-) Transcript_30460:20-445(-)
MRFEPPVPRSAVMTMTKDVKIGYLNLKAGDIFAIDIARAQRNKDQWISPEQFIPERFDPKSPYYLTPAGQKRHPMSFGPFLGGKRVCLGKTFAEYIERYVVASFIHRFPHLEFEDKQSYERLPAYNLSGKETIPIFVRQAQ